MKCTCRGIQSSDFFRFLIKVTFIVYSPRFQFYCVLSATKSLQFFFFGFRLFITTAVSFSASKISQLLFFFHSGFSSVTFPLIKLIGCKIIDLLDNLRYLHMWILWICFCRPDIVCVMWDIHCCLAKFQFEMECQRKTVTSDSSSQTVHILISIRQKKSNLFFFF